LSGSSSTTSNLDSGLILSVFDIMLFLRDPPATISVWSLQNIVDYVHSISITASKVHLFAEGT
jgi:hypothetical protein